MIILLKDEVFDLELVVQMTYGEFRVGFAC